MSNRMGTVFSVTTFGESHGPCVGAVVDGCPSRLELSEADVQPQLDRRRPGQSSLTTPRDEADKVRIVSGVDGGLTLGGPIGLLIDNRDTRPGDYAKLRTVPRPSHADFTYREKYGITASSGGGRASARETVGRVAAGAVAEKLLRERYGVEIVAWVSAVGAEICSGVEEEQVSRADVDAHAVRCPDPAAAERMAAVIHEAGEARDSVGGVVTCVCRGVPIGLGEPVFGKAEALLAAAMLSLPAARGFDVGAGFESARLRGSRHNDAFVMKAGRLGTATNRSGGIQGGVTNGEPVVFRTAFKPAASIGVAQSSADYAGRPAVVETAGRHDPCVVPRAVPVVEAMAALVLADLALLARV